MKKRRNDAWDAALTEAQRWEAYEKAKGASWTAFADWCAAEFGVRPGKNAIYDWQAWMRRQEGAHRLERTIAARQELKGLSDYAALDARTASGRNWNRDVIADRRYEQQRLDEIARAALDRQALTERQRLISRATVDAAQAKGQSELTKTILETQADRYAADQELAGTQAAANADRYAADQRRIGQTSAAQTAADATRYAAEQGHAAQVAAAQLGAQADTYAADQTLAGANAAAQARVQAAQEAARGNVQAAKAQARGNVGAAMARSVAGGADDPAKAYLDRGSEMYRLAMSAKRNGLTPNDLVALDFSIDQDTSLSPAQKAQKKRDLRNNNEAAANQFMVYADYYYRLAGLPGVALPDGVAQMPLPARPNPEVPVPAPTPTPALVQTPAQQDAFTQTWN